MKIRREHGSERASEGRAIAEVGRPKCYGARYFRSVQRSRRRSKEGEGEREGGEMGSERDTLDLSPFHISDETAFNFEAYFFRGDWLSLSFESEGGGSRWSLEREKGGSCERQERATYVPTRVT